MLCHSLSWLPPYCDTRAKPEMGTHGPGRPMCVVPVGSQLLGNPLCQEQQSQWHLHRAWDPQLNHQYSLAKGRSPEKGLDLHNAVSSYCCSLMWHFLLFPALLPDPFFFFFLFHSNKHGSKTISWAAKPRISIFCTHISLHPNNKTWRHTSIETTHKTRSSVRTQFFIKLVDIGTEK